MPDKDTPVEEALQALNEATTDEEKRAIEEQLLVQSDNRPHDGDPEQPEEVEDGNV